MQTVKLTVLIEDHADLDMEVRVVAQDHEAAVAAAPVAAIKSRIVPVTTASDDGYALGGYAGI
jgi:hypothetical protein